MVASKSFISKLKNFDTTTICPNRLAQKQIFWTAELAEFVVKERLKIKKLKDSFEKEVSLLPNWSLLGIGGYFAYLRYNSNSDSVSIAKKLLYKQSILTIPGDMFFPKEKNLFIKERRSIRIAFANSTSEEINDLFKRLKKFSF